MSLKQTRLGKVLTSVSRYGLRAGINDAAARWARSRLTVPYDVVGDYRWVLTQDNPARLPKPKEGPLKINWLLPGVSKGSGGELNIFRTIHFLERWGHENRVFVLGRNTASGGEAKELARSFYFPVKAPIEILDDGVPDSDALVATHWTTAYAARAIANTAGKFYFVQDLEDRFYAEGSFAEFAKETYRWGFHGITLGPWIGETLSREFGMRCSPFGFSFDREVYTPNGVHPAGGEKKKRVLFYARPQTERRGFELGILALSLVARKISNTEFVLVGFPPRDIRLPFSAVVPGILPPKELAALYRRCDAAVVLSHTNLSMLPLELMACGCAVVSNTGRNVEWLLTDETTQLARPTPAAIADAVVEILEDDQLRLRKIAAGLAFAAQTDWVAEIRQVESGFCEGLRVPVREQVRI